MNTTPSEAVMPPLPSAKYDQMGYSYTADQMLAYAQAYAAQRTAALAEAYKDAYKDGYIQGGIEAARHTQELEAKLAAAEKQIAVLESENANLLHALKAELQGQTFMGEPFIPALTPKEKS